MSNDNVLVLKDFNENIIAMGSKKGHVDSTYSDARDGSQSDRCNKCCWA